MNVTLVGATGAIGAQVTDQLRSRGHSVTAYVRNPAKVPADWGEGVNVVVGELSDPTAVDEAVAGANAVISALGPDLSRKATGLPLVDGTKIIVAAMSQHGVRRYIGLGTPSMPDAREQPTWQTRLTTFMAKTFLRRAYDELIGMTDVITASDLDWTVVRYIAPKHGPARDRLREASAAPTSSGSTSPAPTSPPCRRPDRQQPLRRTRTRHQQLKHAWFKSARQRCASQERGGASWKTPVHRQNRSDSQRLRVDLTAASCASVCDGSPRLSRAVRLPQLRLRYTSLAIDACSHRCLTGQGDEPADQGDDSGRTAAQVIGHAASGSLPAPCGARCRHAARR
jgi:putative NADH-flavin reductase